MKVAVISSYPFIRIETNYGALLQYYALQTYLKRRGHDVCWIRNILFKQSLIDKTKYFCSYKSLKLLFYSFINRLGFAKFVQDYVTLSKNEYRNYQMLLAEPPEADAYITGSDQVWGSSLYKENFLTFVPKKKLRIAYAASFGKSDLSLEECETIKPWLKDFDAISVREKDGVDICNKMNIKSEHLLDPTLLLNAKDYPTSATVPTNYCYMYFLNIKKLDEIRWTEIKDYLCNRGMGYYITAIQGAERLFKNENLLSASPEKWLSYYKNARLIVTNSFHGTVFAIIFHIPFVTILQNGNTAKQNNRIYSLLKIFCLESRIWGQNEQLEMLINQPINWVEVENIRKMWITKSNLFFQSLGL